MFDNQRLFRLVVCGLLLLPTLHAYLDEDFYLFIDDYLNSRLPNIQDPAANIQKVIEFSEELRMQLDDLVSEAEIRAITIPVVEYEEAEQEPTGCFLQSSKNKKQPKVIRNSNPKQSKDERERILRLMVSKAVMIKFTRNFMLLAELNEKNICEPNKREDLQRLANDINFYHRASAKKGQKRRIDSIVAHFQTLASNNCDKN